MSLTACAGTIMNHEEFVPRTGRLLVVEDDEEFLEIVVRRLGRRGFEVRGTHDARSALDACQQSEFQVALVDGSLPDAHGLALLGELKLHCAGLRVIMLSGHADSASAATALARGAYAYLVKPCSLAQIEETVRRALEDCRDAT